MYLFGLSFRLFLFVVFFNVLFISNNVSAHARWVISVEDGVDSLLAPRTNATGLKEPAPCGGVARTLTPKVLMQGDSVFVKFKETINHPGHFRIAFSSAADAGFDQNILMDDFPHAPANEGGADANGIYTKMITLPDVKCSDCTLQLIQFMSDSMTNYYSCADIQLTATGAPPPVGGDVTPPADITGLSITSGDTQASLVWMNPDTDFFQVLILKYTSSIATAPNDAINYVVGDMIGASTVIYAGNGTTHTAQNLMNNDTYFFKLFAYDASLNYAAGVERNVTLAAAPVNIAPTISMIAEQSQTVTSSVIQNAGDVIVQVDISDLNPSDTHTIIWTVSDIALVDLAVADDIYTFAPNGVAAGTYTLDVTVTDNGSPNMEAKASLSIVVVAAATGDNSNNTSSSGGGGSLNSFVMLIGLIFGFRRVVLKRRW